MGGLSPRAAHLGLNIPVTLPDSGYFSLGLFMGSDSLKGHLMCAIHYTLWDWSITGDMEIGKPMCRRLLVGAVMSNMTPRETAGHM